MQTTLERRPDHHAGLWTEKRGSHQNVLGNAQLGRRAFYFKPKGKTRKARRPVARKLEIPDALKLHCARHTFGTVAIAETKNPGLVKEVMEHESLTTTMGYLHPETAQIKIVIDRLNQQKYVM